MLLGSKNIVVEHLVTFSEKDYKQNTRMLIGILPLLKHECYSVYHSTENRTCDEVNFFGNTIIINISSRDVPDKYFFISFLDDDLSTCLETADENVFAFWIRNYECFKKKYNASLLEVSGIDVFSSAVAELQENSNHYCLKTNCCHDEIPLSVFSDMQRRVSPQELADIQNALAGVADDSAMTLETIFSTLERRVAASHKNCRIDVHSMDGLVEMAKTGRISDHLVFVPSFNKQELHVIFEYMRNRNSDPNDSYTLFITKEKILENGYIFMIIENVGVMVQYDKDEYAQGIFSSLFIRNKMLVNILSDYVKNHIPSNHALSLDETTAFLNGLIASLE